jgi:UDP-N-acetylmuramoyl-L-alanyl-D-glutamate--2,6-diaminopimelate ligase
VIGGDGKTTTSLLVSNLLRSEGIRTAYETDLGSCDGVVQATAESRPDSISDACQFLADARDAGSTVAVLELSERMVRSAAFDHLDFDVLILTGGGSVGNDKFGASVEDIALERLREGGCAIVNGDCALAMAAADRAGVPTLTFAMRNEADVSAKVFDQQPGETTLMVTAGEITAVMESALTGPAMASCLLAAVATGLLMEVPLHKAIQAATSLRAVPGRMQRIVEYGKPTVVLDLCGSARRLGAVLRGLRRERNGGRLWVVASGDCEAAASEVAAMGRTAERYTDAVVVTIAPESKGDFLRLAHNWLDGVEKAASPRLIADRESAIAWALSNAGPRDTVLIAGGWPTDSPHGQRAAITADEALVNRILGEYEDSCEEEPVILPFLSAK